ncbi:MAG: radical SAM protein [Candidatus Omnitrophota bacterium]
MPDAFIPKQCLFELTYRCNLRCKHCYLPIHRAKELNKKQIFDAIKQLKDLGYLFITFSGGEIFLRSDFFELAEYARRLNFAVRLFTNGTLIDENIAVGIKKLCPLSVEISLYGFKQNHEAVTREKGSFDRTINAINILRDKSISVFVKTIVMKDNAVEIWNLKRFVRKNLKVFWRGIGGGVLICPTDDGNRSPLRYRLTDSQLKDYFKQESKEIKAMGTEVPFKEIQPNEPLCGAGLSLCNITPNGQVNPCVQIRLKKNNNLKDDSLANILNKCREMNEFRGLVMSDRKDCLGCEFARFCFGCPGISKLEKGSFVAKLPEACRQARFRKAAYEARAGICERKRHIGFER